MREKTLKLIARYVGKSNANVPVTRESTTNMPTKEKTTTKNKNKENQRNSEMRQNTIDARRTRTC